MLGKNNIFWLSTTIPYNTIYIIYLLNNKKYMLKFTTNYFLPKFKTISKPTITKEAVIIEATTTQEDTVTEVPEEPIIELEQEESIDMTSNEFITYHIHEAINEISKWDHPFSYKFIKELKYILETL